MKTYFKELHLSTRKKIEVVRITELVNHVVRESGINTGIVTVFVPHATATIVINEFEPRLSEDYVEWIRRYIPVDAGWKHDEIDDNAYAHIASAIIGPGKIIPLKDGRLVFGTWQEIMLLELDGPRNLRRIIIQIIGD
ncbi:MAG: secondary thiamine-phosphate synthase enzyme YjbQ [Sulfolobales archaeon]